MRFRRAFLLGSTSLIVLSMLLAACQSGLLGSAQATPSVTVPPLPTATATTPPPRTLVVCTGQEPLTLYPYGSSDRSMWSVLEAIYDGPFDTRQFSTQAVILEKMPSLADGDAVITLVTVKAGDLVVDADGNLVALAAGTRVLPTGCAGPDCAVAWDGTSPLQMDQLSVTFKLLPGVNWSDGTPVKASDSVYSFQLASDPDTPASKDAVSRTASYEALDDQSVRWTAKPGYFPTQYDTFFWLPLPQHTWGSLSAEELLTADISSRSPMGWGPYIIDEWVPNDHIQLHKNPAYFRAAEGLPYFDNLVFRFLGEPADNNLAALLSGECDLVDQTSLLDEQIEPVLEQQTANKLKVYVGQGPEWEHLDFGIRPASYDDGYNFYAGDRPSFFGDVRMRQAFAYCTNRQGIVDKPLMGQSSVPASYLPPSHPLYLSDLTPLPFDVSAGSRLLDEMGWKDTDGDPSTPRQSMGMADIPDGTPLEVNYVTTQAPLRMEIARQLTESLAQCGIKVNVQYANAGEMFAQGPTGPLFGRSFDLAQFSWESGTQPPCWLYESSQIPTAANNWLGVNITGYSNPEYDAACQAARQTRPDQTALYDERYQAAQRLFAQELPVIPLFFRLKIAISRPDLCGFEMDVSARSSLWNLEGLNYGEGCQ